ncbi:hypothetical protein ACJ41O_009452 [Fusarium nematophilum]
MALPEDFSNLPSIRFTGINHLSEQTYKADEDALVVQGVPVHQFHGIGDAREKQGRHFRISLYLASSGLLAIATPRRAHIRLHNQLTNEIGIHPD